MGYILGHLNHAGSLVHHDLEVSHPDILVLIRLIVLDDLFGLVILHFLQEPLGSTGGVTTLPRGGPAYELCARTTTIAVIILVEVHIIRIRSCLVAHQTEVDIGMILIVVVGLGGDEYEAVGLRAHLHVGAALHGAELTVVVHVLNLVGGVGDGRNLPEHLNSTSFGILIGCAPCGPELTGITLAIHKHIVCSSIHHTGVDFIVSAFHNDGHLGSCDSIVGVDDGITESVDVL